MRHLVADTITGAGLGQAKGRPILSVAPCSQCSSYFLLLLLAYSPAVSTHTFSGHAIAYSQGGFP